MKYAVIKTGGKQYRVQENDTILIENEDLGRSKDITFNEVLLVKQEKKISIGKPHLVKAVVEGDLIGRIKEKKIRIAKFRAKSRYRKVIGHRQQKIKVKINKISL